MIVHLNGWPGAGKKTIGAHLARTLQARFIHNHLLHDIAIVCAGLDGPDRWTLYEAVRAAAYTALARRPASETFVMTNALCRDTPREQEAWRKIVDLAITRRVALVPVVLELSLEENCRRIASTERVGKKITDSEALRAFIAADTLQKPDVDELLVLDVTPLSAEQAADRIDDHLKSIRNGLEAATARHLRFL